MLRIHQDLRARLTKASVRPALVGEAQGLGVVATDRRLGMTMPKRWPPQAARQSEGGGPASEDKAGVEA